MWWEAGVWVLLPPRHVMDGCSQSLRVLQEGKNNWGWLLGAAELTFPWRCGCKMRCWVCRANRSLEISSVETSSMEMLQGKPARGKRGRGRSPPPPPPSPPPPPRPAALSLPSRSAGIWLPIRTAAGRPYCGQLGGFGKSTRDVYARAQKRCDLHQRAAPTPLRWQLRVSAWLKRCPVPGPRVQQRRRKITQGIREKCWVVPFVTQCSRSCVTLYRLHANK
ncbi:uncharacterized protein LOC109370582 isoform X4 [Meleagris gallopavo]|uniref:uncharacterized protein LOC109370582 isoform X4 n=1 Tax=Meleagris gallopavo TaxID=9103 RepID=UPI00093E0DC6|nr:uncharacterized protein LOC109370582 isoform X4 [Meleagris gallopavo]